MVKLITEIASCHNQDLDMAKALIESASINGAKIVKFQDYKAANVPDTDPDKRRYESLEFPDHWYEILIPYCQERGVEFMTTCFNANRAAYLAGLGLKRIKLASISLTNTDLLMAAGAYFDEVILSTAMHTQAEIEQAIDQLETSAKEYTIMHCVGNYPASPEVSNLDRINKLKEMVGPHGSVGFSDHCLDIKPAIFAMSMGIKYLEKHYTLSRETEQPTHQMYEGGPRITTHQIAIEPDELAKLSYWNEWAHTIKGSGEFKPNEVERLIRSRYQNRYGK